MAEFWQLHFHKPHNRIVFPVRTRERELVGAVGRAVFDETQPKMYNFFGFESGLTLGGLQHVMGCPRVLVVEGFFDVMNVWYWAQQRNMDVVCTFGSKCSDQQSALLQRLDATVLCGYDQDEAGNSGWKSMSKQLVLTTYIKKLKWADPGLDMGDFTERQFTEVVDD